MVYLLIEFWLNTDNSIVNMKALTLKDVIDADPEVDTMLQTKVD
jgi:phage FluMu protein gp41